MRATVGLLVGLAVLALALVAGHMALTAAARLPGAVGEGAATTCVACH